MKLTTATVYAIRAVCQLTASEIGSRLSSAKLAEQGGMPARYLVQILLTLNRAGIVQSVRGVGGGYTLARSPEEISLLEIIEAVNGPFEDGGPMPETFPASAAEHLNHALSSIRDLTRQRLQKITLADLVCKPCQTIVVDQAHVAPPAPHRWKKYVAGLQGINHRQTRSP